MCVLHMHVQKNGSLFSAPFFQVPCFCLESKVLSICKYNSSANMLAYNFSPAVSSMTLDIIDHLLKGDGAQATGVICCPLSARSFQ